MTFVIANRADHSVENIGARYEVNIHKGTNI